MVGIGDNNLFITSWGWYQDGEPENMYRRFKIRGKNDQLLGFLEVDPSLDLDDVFLMAAGIEERFPYGSIPRNPSQTS